MSTLKYRIEELKLRIKKITKKNGNGSKFYEKDLKEDVISLHYETGRTINSIAVELNIGPPMVAIWKRNYGRQRTVVVYGKGVRNDVRTKALAVQEYVNGVESSKIAVKYGVTQSTIYLWINKYESKYQEYLNLSDGIMVIAPEEKQVFGNKNIEEVEQMLKSQTEALNTLLQNQHYTKAELETLNKMKDKTSKSQKDLNTLKDTAKKLHIKL